MCHIVYEAAVHAGFLASARSNRYIAASAARISLDLTTSAEPAMIDAFSKSLGQLPDFAFIRVILLAAMLTCLVFLATGAGLYMLGGSVLWTDIPVLGTVIGWIGSLAGTIAAFGLVGLMFGGAWFLFAPVMIAMTGLFLDDICRAVEARHYPGLGPARKSSTGEAVGQSLRFIALVAGVNLLALPLYLFFMFFAGAGIILYFLVNGYLFGREYFELVACRRMPPDAATVLRRRRRVMVLLFGIAVAVLMALPVINLLAPVLATATMLHLFQGFAAEAEAAPQQQLLR